ncbi:DUF4352 domain-containing protein [Streptomyces sp. KLOTTS4A1]|uniref:DUF4190 domain-containing protein n=1 Tax=Streptomyces sp. KLOTTS4A1 TaxID=3390996 RepID=UPI0039F61F81
MSTPPPPGHESPFAPPHASGAESPSAPPQTSGPDSPFAPPQTSGPDSPFASPPVSGPVPPQGPAMGTPYPMPPAPGPYMMAPRNGLGIAGLVTGIIGAVLFLTVWLGIILGILGLVFGLIGRSRAKRGEATNGGVALAGAILGGIAIVASTVWLVFAVIIVSDAVDEAKDEVTQIEKDTSGAGGTDAEADGDAEAEAAVAFGESYVYEDGLSVTVSKPAAYKPDEFAVGHTKGNKAFQFTITIENGGKRKLDLASAYPMLRDGEGTEAEMVFDGSNSTKPFAGSVLPGKKATATYAFSVPAGAETDLQLELSPEFLEYEPAIWSGSAE